MHYFFIGIAGDGMSALAQYATGKGHKVSGSDRQFSKQKSTERRKKLEAEGINCFPQDESGITKSIDKVVISTAIEPTVPEYIKAKKLGIKIIMRSVLLAEFCNTQNTVAVSGTSGKSTVTAMIYTIFDYAGLSPSLITGAGLVNLQNKGKIGNAVAGQSEILIIEADESDGSLIKYKPQTGLILNIEKDHKTIKELRKLFSKFSENTQNELIVNRSNAESSSFSKGSDYDFMKAPYQPIKLNESVNGITFQLADTDFSIPQIGAYNAENATAAIATAAKYGVSIKTASEALKSYHGIHRRNQILGIAKGITVIDDYAHNPAKLSAALKACQALSQKVFLWFQPHGFGPTKFLHSEFVKELSDTARPNDEIIFSEIYYAGGTADKSISAEDLIKDMQKKNTTAVYLKNRKELVTYILANTKKNAILLLCGARDPSLNGFAEEVFEKLKNNNK